MVFKTKFFLDLGAEGEQLKPVTIAPPAAQPATQAKPDGKGKSSPAAAQPGPAVAAAQDAPAKPATDQTTAEAIAAELAAAQANRPAPSLATFAPDCVTAGGAQPRGRRRGGADLGGFREMARDMTRS